MPRIDDRFLDCSIYLYPDEPAARTGDRVGGSGFLIAMPAQGNWLIEGSCPARDFHHLYAVSNRHVSEKNPVVRLNTHDGRFDVLALDKTCWTFSDVDDLAIAPLDHSKAYRYLSISIDDFLSQEILQRWDIGLGDEVFMVGRFINHEGRQQNSPTMRFGHISMMPGEPLTHSRNQSGFQESFLVEVHSIGGYSGSPVFVRPFASLKLPFSSAATNTAVSGLDVSSAEIIKGRPWLLGIEWGVILDLNRSNTGVSGVIPSWCLRRLLEHDDILTVRKMQQEALKGHHDRSGTALT